MNPIVRAVALVLAPLAVTARADVLVVDPAGGAGTYLTIEDAVQAATDGDTVVVHSGTYLTFYVDDKSVDIVAAPGAYVQLTVGPRVVNLSPGKRVLLSGLEMRGTAATSPLFAGRGLTLLDNQGSVRIQDCYFTGANNLTNPSSCVGINGGVGWPGVLVQYCLDVTFVECGMTGGRGLWFPQIFGCPKWTGGGTGGPGLAIESSNVALFHTFAQGGDGGQAGWGGAGGSGLLYHGPSLFSAGGAYVGGSGGTGYDWLWGPGGDGGTGAQVGGFENIGIDFQSFGGAAGQGGFGFPSGSPGWDLVGSFAAHPGPARNLRVAGVAVGGSPVTFTFEGVAGDLPVLLVGSSEAHYALWPLPLFIGVESPTLIPLAPLAANGKLVAPLTTPPVPSEAGAWTLALQAAFVTTGGDLAVGSPRHLVLLSQAP